MKFASIPKRILAISLLTIVPLCAAFGQDLGNPPMATDAVVIVEGASNLIAGANANVVAADSGKAVVLKSGELTGYTTVQRQPKFKYNELIPCWNVVCPNGTGMRMLVSILPQPKESDWFEVARWGNYAFPTPVIPKQKFSFGEYVTDTLLLKNTANSIAWRIEFFRPTAESPSPSLTLLSACYSNTLKNRAIYDAFGDKRAVFMPATGKKFQLDVPFRAQDVSDPARVGSICSPTSVVTAIGKFGINADLNNACDLIYEPYEKIYGNWIRAITTASQLGVRGYIARFRNIYEIQDALKKGHVVCASIKFADNSVPKEEVPPMYGTQGTDGHLICIIGIDADGWVITHDNASRSKGVACRWSQNAMKTVWFDSRGGVGYVFTGKR